MSRKQKRQLKNFILLMLAAVAVMLALLLFRVRKVVVSGNSNHSSEEIAEGLLTDFLSKNTIYLWWTHKDGDIPETMPYLESMSITIRSPSSVLVQVTEKTLVGYLETDDGRAYFDASGYVLELSDTVYANIPVVVGASIGEITLYQKVPTESSSQLRTILNLIDLLNYYELSVKQISFAEDSEITVTIGYIDAVLGQDEYLEEKVANLAAVLNTMSANLSGTLHLENVTGKSEDIIFTSTGEVTVTETEAETEEAELSQEEEASEDISITDSSTLGGAATDGSITTGTAEEAAQESAEEAAEEAAVQEEEETVYIIAMVFNSSGQLVYNVHIENGVVVDSYGNEVPGCSVNENGYVVDAYMNIIDPVTGDLMN